MQNPVGVRACLEVAVLQVAREAVDDHGVPTFGLLSIEYHSTNVPIQREQFPIGRQPGADLRGLNTNLGTPDSWLYMFAYT
jgi:hypothetical protein